MGIGPALAFFGIVSTALAYPLLYSKLSLASMEASATSSSASVVFAEADSRFNCLMLSCVRANGLWISSCRCRASSLVITRGKEPLGIFAPGAGSSTDPLLGIPPTAATDTLGILYGCKSTWRCLGIHSLAGSFGLAGVLGIVFGSPAIYLHALYQWVESICITVGFPLWCLLWPCLMVVSL